MQATAQVSSVIEHLLLSAPRERRLDLAIATLLHKMSQEHALVVVDGKQVIEPIWYFARGNGLSPYAYALRPMSLFAYHAPFTLGPVPFYSQESESYEQVVRWFAHHQGMGFRMTCDRGLDPSVKVTAVPGNPTEGHLVREREGRPNTGDWQKEIYRLTCLVVLDTCAPELVPLLDSDQVPQLLQPRSFLDYPHVSRAQRVILLPRQIPAHTSTFDCMSQEYDHQTQMWKRCSQIEQEEDDGDEEHYAPEACPVCGGYYCKRHFSTVSYWFDSTALERWHDGSQLSMRQQLKICIHCAALSEEDARLLRATRLALNAEGALYS